MADVSIQSFITPKYLCKKDTGTFFYQYTQFFSPKYGSQKPTELGLVVREIFCTVIMHSKIIR